ncbi:transposase [Paracoccus sp. 08]|nr:transposase [Paracoccus sp. 08]
MFQGAVASDPDALTCIIQEKAPNCLRVGMETGSTTLWLWRALRARGLPIICMDARHANRALSMRKNKTDKNDAQGLAELRRIGWFKEANVRSPHTQYVRSLLSVRYQLRLSRKDMLNQMRGPEALSRCRLHMH